MVKNVSADESDVGSWLLWLGGLGFGFVDLKLNSVLLKFLAEGVTELKGIHKVLSIFETFLSSFLSSLSFNFHYFVFGKRINLVLSGNINLVILLFSFLEHSFVFSIVFLLDQESLLIGLSPDADSLICPDSYEEVTNA